MTTPSTRAATLAILNAIYRADVPAYIPDDLWIIAADYAAPPPTPKEVLESVAAGHVPGTLIFCQRVCVLGRRVLFAIEAGEHGSFVGHVQNSDTDMFWADTDINLSDIDALEDAIALSSLSQTFRRVNFNPMLGVPEPFDIFESNIRRRLGMHKKSADIPKSTNVLDRSWPVRVVIRLTSALFGP